MKSQKQQSKSASKQPKLTSKARKERISELYLLLNMVGKFIDPTPVVFELVRLHGYAGYEEPKKDLTNR